MKKLVVNFGLILLIVFSFVILGERNNSTGFWDYYLNEKLDLFISLLIIFITCLLDILDYEHKRLNGQWSVKVVPKRWENRSGTYIGEGHMVLTMIEKRQYKGYLYLEWKNDIGDIVIKGLYELKFYLKFFRTVKGKSIMQIRESYNREFPDTDKARVNFCDYSLKLSGKGNTLTGSIIMNKTGTESNFYATREITI